MARALIDKKHLNRVSKTEYDKIILLLKQWKKYSDIGHQALKNKKITIARKYFKRADSFYKKAQLRLNIRR